MAKSSHESGDFIKELTDSFLTGNTTDVVDIITFMEAPWGLNFKPFPVQRFILRSFYGMELDDKEKYIPVPDMVNEKVLYWMTEREFLKYLYDEGKCNTNEVTGKNFKELDLVVGRRGGKCRSKEDRIATTIGSITFSSLLERKNSGGNIGIFTYEPNTLKRQITYDFTIWDNGNKPCFELITKSGIKETSSGNHPYLMCNDRNEKPKFVNLEDLKVGDRVAISKELPLFGSGSIGINKARLLGFIIGNESVELGLEYWLKDIKNNSDENEKEDIVNWIKSINFCQNGVEGIVLPECLYTGSREEVHSFFQALYYCNPFKSSNVFVFKSIQIGDGIRHLLLKLGISSSVNNVENGLYAVEIKSVSDLYSNDENYSDVFWDVVKEIKPVGVKETVDLCVEGTHIIGGDIISHNSIMVSTISAYELYKLIKRGNPLEYYGFPPHEKICLLNVAPSDDQGRIIFDQTMKLASACPYMTPRILNPTQESFGVMTDLDMTKAVKKATVHVLAGGCSSFGLRGQNSILVAMDEAAFFLENGGRFSGKEVYKALTPSTTSFGKDGKVICISSPYARYGMFFERYEQSFDEKETTLMFQMYTTLVNPKIPSVDMKTARRRNRSAFMAEFGAEFTDSVSAWIDDEVQFRQCITTDKTIVDRGEVGVQYFMGLDLGIKNDGTAIAITHKDDKTGKIVLDYASVWYSGSSDVWLRDDSIYRSCIKYKDKEVIKVLDVCQEICRLVKWFPIKSGFFDQYNGYALMELLHKEGLKQFRMEAITDGLNNDLYQLFKTLYLDNLIEIPDNPIYIPELLSLQEEKIGKNKIRVKAPNKEGAHDDISDAISISVFECFNAFHGNQAKITSMIGNGNGRSIVGGTEAIQNNMSMYQMNKIMKHGMTPRNTTFSKSSSRFYR